MQIQLVVRGSLCTILCLAISIHGFGLNDTVNKVEENVDLEEVGVIDATDYELDISIVRPGDEPATTTTTTSTTTTPPTTTPTTTTPPTTTTTTTPPTTTTTTTPPTTTTTTTLPTTAPTTTTLPTSTSPTTVPSTAQASTTPPPVTTLSTTVSQQITSDDNKSSSTTHTLSSQGANTNQLSVSESTQGSDNSPLADPKEGSDVTAITAIGATCACVVLIMVVIVVVLVCFRRRSRSNPSRSNIGKQVTFHTSFGQEHHTTEFNADGESKESNTETFAVKSQGYIAADDVYAVYVSGNDVALPTDRNEADVENQVLLQASSGNEQPTTEINADDMPEESNGYDAKPSTVKGQGYIAVGDVYVVHESTNDTCNEIDDLQTNRNKADVDNQVPLQASSGNEQPATEIYADDVSEESNEYNTKPSTVKGQGYIAVGDVYVVHESHNDACDDIDLQTNRKNHTRPLPHRPTSAEPADECLELLEKPATPPRLHRDDYYSYATSQARQLEADDSDSERSVSSLIIY